MSKKQMLAILPSVLLIHIPLVWSSLLGNPLLVVIFSSNNSAYVFLDYIHNNSGYVQGIHPPPSLPPCGVYWDRPIPIATSGPTILGSPSHPLPSCSWPTIPGSSTTQLDSMSSMPDIT